jgi:hypothetical protein
MSVDQVPAYLCEPPRLGKVQYYFSVTQRGRNDRMTEPVEDVQKHDGSRRVTSPDRADAPNTPTSRFYLDTMLVGTWGLRPTISCLDHISRHRLLALGGSVRVSSGWFRLAICVAFRLHPLPDPQIKQQANCQPLWFAHFAHFTRIIIDCQSTWVPVGMSKLSV